MTTNAMKGDRRFRLFRGRRSGTDAASPNGEAYVAPVCSHPGCGSLQVVPCGYQQRFETARCGTFWCRTHIALVGEVPCCPSHAPLLAAVATAGSGTASAAYARQQGATVTHLRAQCSQAGCPIPEVWPCAFTDQNGHECGTMWCLDHIEFVGQNRFCHRHAMLVGAAPGRCAFASCGGREVWACSYHDRHGRICGTAHCREHVTFIGAVPFCREHASMVGTLAVGARSVREIKTLPTLDDKCAALAMFISEDLDEEVTALLKVRFADRPDVTVMADERVRDMWYKQQLVWWRTWGALTNTGYLTRVAVWIPMVAPPTAPEVHVLVDSNVVMQAVPEWVQRSLAGEAAQDGDLASFHARVIDAVRGGLDMPAPFLASQESASQAVEAPAEPAGQPARVRVLVVASDRATADGIAELAAGEAAINVVGALVDPNAAVEQARALTPEVAVVEFGSESDAGAWTCEQLAAVVPGTRVLAILEEESQALLLRAHGAGAADVLVWPFAAAALIAAVGRLCGPPERVLASAVIEAPGPAVEPTSQPKAPVWQPPPAEPPPPSVNGVIAAEPSWRPPPPEPAPRTQPGEITVVFSGKGGVGKTLIAMNVAAAVSQKLDDEVGLVDLDLQFGDLAVLLGIKPETSISNAAASYPDLDSEFLGALMPVAPGGLRLLAAPNQPELSDLVKAEHVRAVLKGLRALYRHVVIDCGTHLDDRTLEAVEAADRIVLVVDLDLSTIKNGRVALDLFNRLNIPAERVFVALNRADRERTVTADQVEHLLRHPVAIRLPYEREGTRDSVTDASPTVLLRPDTVFSQQIVDLVRLIGYK